MEALQENTSHNIPNNETSLNEKPPIDTAASNVSIQNTNNNNDNQTQNDVDKEVAQIPTAESVIEMKEKTQPMVQETDQCDDKPGIIIIA